MSTTTFIAKESMVQLSGFCADQEAWKEMNIYLQAFFVCVGRRFKNRSVLLTDLNLYFRIIFTFSFGIHIV